MKMAFLMSKADSDKSTKKVLDKGHVSHNILHIVNYVFSIQRNLNQSSHGAMDTQIKVFFHDFLQPLEKISWVVPKNGHNHICFNSH